MEGGMFYICDLRPAWAHKKCVTFWRPDNAGYAFPLPWAGKYTSEEVVAGPGYYWARRTASSRSQFIRFPISCGIVDAIGSMPTPGIIDGNVGPVVWKNSEIERYLRSNMLSVPDMIAA